MAKNCIQLPTQIGFETAKRLLTERYRIIAESEYKIIAVYRKETKHQSQIKADNVHQMFQNFQAKLKNIGHLQSLNVVDTPDIMQMLLAKLPGSVRDKWSRNILPIQKRLKEKLDLAGFINFFTNKTLIISDLIFTEKAVQKNMDQKSNSRRPKIDYLLKRIMAQYTLKRNELIASIAVKIINWIGAMHS